MNEGGRGAEEREMDRRRGAERPHSHFAAPLAQVTHHSQLLGNRPKDLPEFVAYMDATSEHLDEASATRQGVKAQAEFLGKLYEVRPCGMDHAPEVKSAKKHQKTLRGKFAYSNAQLEISDLPLISCPLIGPLSPSGTNKQVLMTVVPNAEAQAAGSGSLSTGGSGRRPSLDFRSGGGGGAGGAGGGAGGAAAAAEESSICTVSRAGRGGGDAFSLAPLVPPTFSSPLLPLHFRRLRLVLLPLLFLHPVSKSKSTSLAGGCERDGGPAGLPSLEAGPGRGRKVSRGLQACHLLLQAVCAHHDEAPAEEDL